VFPSHRQQTEVIKFPSSLLPVIDLKQGQAVHALAGNRAAYQPLLSRWSDSPGDVLKLLGEMRTKLGLNKFYVADLDAIAGVGHHQPLIRKLVEEGYHLWLDAGVKTVCELDGLTQLGVEHIILASETLQDDEWHQLREHPACNKLVFSLDLYQGKLRAKLFNSDDPLEVVEQVKSWGIRQVIVLDIFSVGTTSGCPTLELCQRIKARHPELHLITGGGIRSLADIEQLEQAGIERVLVSTWLHDPATTFAPSPTA
jgi:HisA/HisF family protein